MDKILFANVGNRSLIITGKYNWIDDKGFIKKEFFKQKTKEIFEDFNNWKNKVKLNILNILPLNKFDKIYLIGTNQGNNEEQDTIYAGRIIQKLINLSSINVLEYTSNPTDRKAVLYYYKKIFKERVKQYDKLYIFVSGGVPAMKEAMVWASLSENMNIEILEVIKGKLIESNIEEIYLKEIYKKSLMGFIQNYDWFGSEKLIGENERLFGDKIDFLYKLKYTNARFNFDFQTANNLLDKLKLSLTEEDIFSKIKIINNLEGIKELLDNIEITYKKGEYTLLLGKVFRLQESIYRYIFEKITNISTEKDRNKTFEDFINFIENNEILKNYLIENKINYSQPNTFVLAKILSYFNENNKLDGIEIILFQITNSIDNLKEIRNLSIVAHGWKGVSKKDLDNENFIKKISTIREKLNMEENIYDEINNFILGEIKSL